MIMLDGVPVQHIVKTFDVIFIKNIELIAVFATCAVTDRVFEPAKAINGCKPIKFPTVALVIDTMINNDDFPVGPAVISKSTHPSPAPVTVVLAIVMSSLSRQPAA